MITNNHCINHIAIVVDKSGSMDPLSRSVVDVFDHELEYLRRRSVELDQETRVSVYLFSDETECVVFDQDCLRVKSLAGTYHPYGWTALLDATAKAIEDMDKLPEMYGDHAFLVYVLTDGAENSSKTTSAMLSDRIKSLPDNWTIACMVPDNLCVFEAKKSGFPAGSVQVWDSTNKRGMEEAGKSFRSSLESYMVNRSHGIRGTREFFAINTKNLSNTTVSTSMVCLDPGKYQIIENRKNGALEIREFVESWGIRYYKGGSYYELIKKEGHVQGYKEICIQNRYDGKVYSGRNARSILGLPNDGTTECAIEPGDFGSWRIFIQSTSTNRHIIPGEMVLVLL